MNIANQLDWEYKNDAVGSGQRRWTT